MLFPPLFPQRDNIVDAQLWRERFRGLKKCMTYTPRGGRHPVSIPAADGSTLTGFVHLPPNDDNNLEKLPVLLWIHPGGWVVGSSETETLFAAQCADLGRFLVVNIDYRLAPEHPFPAAVDDVTLALRWTYANIARFGGDPSRLVVAGESSGGNLAAALVSRNLDALHTPAAAHVPVIGLILVSPVLAAHQQYDSYVRYGNVGLLTTQLMQHFRDLYLASAPVIASNQSYWYAPLLTPTYILRKYPPVVLMQGRFDLLVDEGLHFKDLLESSGVSVSHAMFGSFEHAFLGNTVEVFIGHAQRLFGSFP